MSRWFAIIILLSGNAFAKLDETLAPSKTCEHDALNFRCVKFIKNYDADTVTFFIPNVHPLLGEKISVRVRGIDTAEKKGKHPCEKDQAFQAQELVGKTLEAAKRIDLVNVDRDKYFRILADIQADGRSIKDILEEADLGYSYNGGSKQNVNWCEFGKKRVPTSKDSP
ncbi:MAG: thermonuclease family protein [Pseudobdellovibrio sp.]|nr:thermonuclease family protein [Pseudobdellovibrio sp.]